MPGNVVFSPGVLGPRFVFAALLLLALLFGLVFFEIDYVDDQSRVGLGLWFFYLTIYPFCYALAWGLAQRDGASHALAVAGTVGGVMLMVGLILSLAAIFGGLMVVGGIVRALHLSVGRTFEIATPLTCASLAGLAVGYGLDVAHRSLLGEPIKWRFSSRLVHMLSGALAGPVVFATSLSLGMHLHFAEGRDFRWAALSTLLVWLVSIAHMAAIWFCLPRSAANAIASAQSRGRMPRLAIMLVPASVSMSWYLSDVVSRI